MKLYRAKIPAIAHDTIQRLTEDGDIEVLADNLAEAEADLSAILDEFMRRDAEFYHRIKDDMAAHNTPYDEFGRIRKRMSDELSHPVGDDVERFLCRQFVECLMISPFIEEVFAEDRLLYRKIMEVLRNHHVDEREIREAAMARIKNIQEGTVEYEIALDKAIRETKKRRGLFG